MTFYFSLRILAENAFNAVYRKIKVSKLDNISELNTKAEVKSLDNTGCGTLKDAINILLAR
jgi:hypothetical protein